MRAHYCWREVGSVAMLLRAMEGRAFALPGTEPSYPPDRPVVLRHLHLDVRVDPTECTVDGRCTLSLMPIADRVERVRLDASDLEIDDVWVQGHPEAASFDYDGRHLDVHLPAPATLGEALTVLVRYRVQRPRLGLYFIHPDAGAPDRPIHVWSQNQDDDARYWFPCMDEPGMKLTTSVDCTVPDGFVALSNGEPGAEDPTPYHVPGWHTYHWHLSSPQPIYLLTLAIGPFREVVADAAELPIRHYCLPGQEASVEQALGRTADIIRFFSEYTGVPYPYGRYGHVVVSEFVFGGMEHTTLTTLTDRCIPDERAALDYSPDGLVAHELAHQWFGDLVTCREWAHGWLNEGFATYFDCLFREHDLGREEMDLELLELAESYFEEDGGRYRRPVVSREFAEPIDLFDRHLYNKASWVLHMLRGKLGETAFRRGVRTYLERFRHNQAETDDLRRALEDATGTRLAGFFDTWIHGKGYPELRIQLDSAPPPGTVRVVVEQVLAEGQAPWHLDTDLLVGAGDEVTRIPVRLRQPRETVTVPGQGRAPDRIILDPDGWLLARMRPELGAPMLARILETAPSVLRRIDAAAALGRSTARGAVASLTAALSSAGFWGVRARVAAALGQAGTPEAETALLAALADEAHPKARRAVAGSERATSALLGLLASAAPSAFVEAEACRSLGRIRSARAHEALVAALERESFIDVVRASAREGLGGLRTIEAFDVVAAHALPTGPTLSRAAAIAALGALGRDVPDLRPAALDRMAALKAEPSFRIQMALVSALHTLGTDGAARVLGEVGETAADARVRRRARQATLDIRRQRQRPGALGALGDDIELLRTAQAALRSRLERVERTDDPGR